MENYHHLNHTQSFFSLLDQTQSLLHSSTELDVFFLTSATLDLLSSEYTPLPPIFILRTNICCNKCKRKRKKWELKLIAYFHFSCNCLASTLIRLKLTLTLWISVSSIAKKKTHTKQLIHFWQCNFHSTIYTNFQQIQLWSSDISVHRIQCSVANWIIQANPVQANHSS